MVRMLDQKILRTQYKHAKDRLFLFDYDGTLTPIVSNPAAAIPNDETIHTLKSLAQNPKNVVWIISGRDQQFLEKYFRGIAEIGLSAEHGCFMRPPRCGSWKNLTDSSNLGWQKEVMETYQRFVDTTPGSNIEQKKVALTWHYRGADPAVGKSQAERCRKSLQEGVLKKYNVEVIAGKANLEVRPRFVNKGYMTSQLADEFSSKNGHPPGFVLCAGDDFTDEGS